MDPTNRAARIAGALYAIGGLTTPFSLIYVPSKLIVSGNAAATATNILGSETLFRMGILGGLISTITFMFLVMALYRLLSEVSKTQASLMVMLALISAPISFFNVISEIAALNLLRGADFLSVFDQGQREALAMVLLGLRRPGFIVAEIFWGLWLLPFGVLVMRSRFLPRILGALLIVNGFAYVAVSLTSLLLPDYASIVSRWAFPAELGELWIMLWLLIKGVRVRPTAASAISK